jgi:autotransporter adhesin
VYGYGTIGIGRGAIANNHHATAIGEYAEVSAYGSVALGASSVCDREYAVSVGTADNGRYITHVLPGEQDDDAVTVAQLKDAALQVNPKVARRLGNLEARIATLRQLEARIAALERAAGRS